MHNDAMGKPAVRTPLFEKQSSGHYTGLHKVSDHRLAKFIAGSTTN